MSTRMPPSAERSSLELGENLTAWRKVLGLTAEQVAERADISRETLRKLERGETNIRYDVFLRVANTLGVLGEIVKSSDPLRSDLGRARAGEINRKRVR